MAKENIVKRSADSGILYGGLPEELLHIARSVAAAHPPVEPAEDFRFALRARLVREGARLRDEPAPAHRKGLLVPAAVGAAAVSVAGLALLAWRTRAIPTLLAHAQSQARTAQSSS